jgi:hypothetical protein
LDRCGKSSASTPEPGDAMEKSEEIELQITGDTDEEEAVALVAIR